MCARSESKEEWCRVTLEQINSLQQEEFADALGAIFENSPWVAERAWLQRPFTSIDHLWREMNAAVEAASQDAQLALVRAHPDLGTRAGVSERSAGEQAGAGLNALDEAEYEMLLAMNREYRRRFDFPFIFAVKGSGKSDILHALMTRLDSTREEELHQALWEVGRIARFRLEDITSCK